MVVGESETETVATAPASGVRTVTARDPLTPPLLATMATLPPLTALIRPLDDTVAIAGSTVVQVTV